MDSYAPPRETVSVAHLIYQFGICGMFSVLCGIILTIWLVILIFRPRPLSDYVAYFAATLFPLLFGSIGATLGAMHWLRVIGDSGGGPSSPAEIANVMMSDILLRLLTGCSFTGLFLVLGVVVLLSRRPDVARET